jgi:type I restriction enzyme S subunit
MGKYQGYEKYKDSSVEWLGEIPEHWEVKKLKFVTTVQPSNVDKKTLDDEAPVLLCNYSDVYNHEWITDEIEFMKATATPSEIKKFLIEKGDIIITKDSERADDIAVPALIAQDFDDVVCGYHLTQIKPKELDGNFLFRLFQCTRFNAQFVVSANGVTRFGLPQRAVNDAFVGFPPLEEQNTIAQFLDHKTSQIDALISKKEALLEKLDEKRTALISHAVTKGLDPSVPMKDSSIEWLGDIPAHWEVTRPKYLCSRIVDGTHHTPEYIDVGVPFITVRNLTLNNGISFKKIRYISYEDHKELMKRANPEKGDILVTKDGTLGVTRVIETDQEFSIFVSLALLKPYHSKINSYYFRDVLESTAISAQFESRKLGSALKHIHLVELSNVFVPLPPLLEQELIRTYIKEKTAEIDQQKSKINKAIDLLKEYRTALITNAVTGKIDVRQVPIPQP